MSGLQLWLGLGRESGQLDRLDALHADLAAENQRIARLDAIAARLAADPPPDDAELDLLERELREIDPGAWRQLQRAQQDTGLP